MDKKFNNKYRIASHRLPGWDYSGNGIYFLTPVIQNHECWLGEIKNGKMIFSDWGRIVKDEFLKSFEIRKELFLNEYIIMPNHMHMIVTLKKVEDFSDDNLFELYSRKYLPDEFPIENQDSDSSPNKQIPKNISHNFYRKPKSITSFMAGFKSAVNSKIDDDIDEKGLDIPKFNRNNHFFQPNYHDRIIRNKKEFYRIRNYIRNNPKKWDNDGFKGK